MATIKQKKAFAKTLENGGVVSTAMVDAGFSPAMAKNPQKLTKSKGWQELINLAGLSDKKLLEKHTQQLNSSKLTKLYFDIDDDNERIKAVCKKLGVELLYIKINKEKTGKTANVKAPDFFFRDLALDKAYKVKGRYSEERGNTNQVLVINISKEIAEKHGINPSTGNNS